jgi:hypothetical protein
MPKMLVTLLKTMINNKKYRTTNFEKQSQNKPNQTQPVVSLSNLFYPPQADSEGRQVGGG